MGEHPVPSTHSIPPTAGEEAGGGILRLLAHHCLCPCESKQQMFWLPLNHRHRGCRVPATAPVTLGAPQGLEGDEVFSVEEMADLPC